ARSRGRVDVGRCVPGTDLEDVGAVGELVAGEGRGARGEASRVDSAFEGGTELAARETEARGRVVGRAGWTGVDRRLRRRGVDRKAARSRGRVDVGRGVLGTHLVGVTTIRERAGRLRRG